MLISGAWFTIIKCHVIHAFTLSSHSVYLQSDHILGREWWEKVSSSRLDEPKYIWPGPGLSQAQFCGWSNSVNVFSLSLLATLVLKV